jgi:hypothetical protein
MGDRANVVIYDPAEDANIREAVFLYGHWSGYDLPTVLQTALQRGKPRWRDAAYLARIIFCEMVGELEGETGYGISTRLTDNEYPLLVVDVPRQVVVEYPEKVYLKEGFAKLADYPGVPLASYTGQWEREATPA